MLYIQVVTSHDDRKLFTGTHFVRQVISVKHIKNWFYLLPNGTHLLSYTAQRKRDPYTSDILRLKNLYFKFVRLLRFKLLRVRSVYLSGVFLFLDITDEKIVRVDSTVCTLTSMKEPTGQINLKVY